MKKIFFSLVILWIISPETIAQTFQVIQAETTIANNGDGFADILPVWCIDNGPLWPTNSTNTFITNIYGFDYWAWSGYIAKVTSSNCPFYVSANNSTLVRIEGDNTSFLEAGWLHVARSHCLLEAEYLAWTNNDLDFTIKCKILPGGGYNTGDPIIIYYEWDIFASGQTKHEAVNEDPVWSNNQFFIGNNNVLLPYMFNFNNPPGLSGWNRKKIRGALNKIVGDIIEIRGVSDLYSKIAIPGVWTMGMQKDKTTAYFSGNIKFSVIPLPPEPSNPKIEFTVDIGSDAELSDPNLNGNEVFDPGDTYIKNGPFMAAPQNGFRNDALIFGTDPNPDPLVAGSAVPCGSGIFTPSLFFEVDDIDVLQTSLLTKLYGPGFPSISYFPDILILMASHFLVSYDDDWAANWSYNQYGSQAVPVNSGSTMLNIIFGKTVNADEVIAVDLDAFLYPSIPLSIDSLWSETNMHPNFNPNPDSQESEDDDVNGLKYFTDENMNGFYYFSVDNETTYTYPGIGPLNPGSIYEASGLGIITEAVNPATHLGLPDGTDVNAFTFGWVWDPVNNRLGLALLFSVDADDWTTTADESGGLDPAMIYFSFLDGTSSEFATGALDDNIDALTLVPQSFNGYSGPSPKDFGDAPDTTYPTLLLNDGARHVHDYLTYLGSLLDTETDGQPTINADGDDLNNLDDEDGVIFMWPLVAGNPCKMKVTASVGNALFNCWFDYNGNGSWADPNEHEFIDFNLIAGDNYLTFIAPQTTKTGSTYSRFRFSHQPALSYTGEAYDGEVEDYKVEVIDYGDIKWQQHPDTLLPGLHADAYILLADDWICNGGVVTDFHWWGNYEMGPTGGEMRGAGINHFLIHIYSNSGCLPALILQSYIVPFSVAMEQNTGLINNEGSIIYKYDYILPEAFIQNNGTIYWLSIQPMPNDPGDPPVWRWQEANRWLPINCGAVSDFGTGWQTITWPPPPLLKYDDLAFAITSWVIDTLELQNIDVGSGQDNCYDATKAIIVAGNGTTFTIQNGGQVTMIAGEKISYLPGTTVYAGGYLHGYITTTGAYCSSIPPAPGPCKATLQIETEIQEEPVIEKGFLRVYPNPTTGNLTVELAGRTDTGSTIVEIYSMMGKRILREEFFGQDKYEISLQTLPPGIYILHAINGMEAWSVKVIKQ